MSSNKPLSESGIFSVKVAPIGKVLWQGRVLGNFDPPPREGRGSGCLVAKAHPKETGYDGHFQEKFGLVGREQNPKPTRFREGECLLWAGYGYSYGYPIPPGIKRSLLVVGGLPFGYLMSEGGGYSLNEFGGKN